MPNYNGQGPYWGGGPAAGWGMGSCGGGQGFGPRYGRGRGFGRRFPVRWTRKDEEKALADEEAMLKEELEAVQTARKELGSEPTK
ncbi:MAG: DUF5320 family protein [Patescibacteria group bacterium]